MTILVRCFSVNWKGDAQHKAGIDLSQYRLARWLTIISIGGAGATKR